MDPNERYVYVGNAGASTISAYTFSRGTGKLTPVSGSPFAAGVVPMGMISVPAPIHK
jgi:hypothetical protein